MPLDEPTAGFVDDERPYKVSEREAGNRPSGIAAGRGRVVGLSKIGSIDIGRQAVIETFRCHRAASAVLGALDGLRVMPALAMTSASAAR